MGHPAGISRITALAVLATVSVTTVLRASLRAEEAGNQGTDVGRQIRVMVEADWIDADRRFAATNVRPGQPVKVNARGVTTTQDAAGAVDGIKNGRFGFHVAVGEKDPWWQVDLGQDYQLDRVVIYNRTDGGHAARTRKICVQVARDGRLDKFEPVYRHDGSVFFGVKENKPLVVRLHDKQVTARIVRLHVAGVCHLALDEVEVYAASDPKKNIALGRPADQKSVSRHSHPGTPGEPTPPWVPADGGFSLAHTRDVIRRARDLATRLQPGADPRRLDPLVANLDGLDNRLAHLKTSPAVPDRQRKEVYFAARRLLRKIALCNPLLDFDKLLLLKRQHPGGVFHICDQYYGFSARPGGGLFVLSDPFGENPKLASLTQAARVENGRLRGQRLVPGSFLSPELSYDAETILFAYTANSEPEPLVAEQKLRREWTTTNSYHLFRIGADGTGLRQLTDGPFDDFDPCFLPNGRIVFVSERRGGYVRCGIRACRSFNLCSMEPDGTNIAPLSLHDTNEWHPSVGHDGKIVFTRWDYIDRDTQVAHHIWTCFPDGSDPRAYHGNYPRRRRDRPWTEMDIRAIPGSHLYVATAAPHHGHSFGSLIWIDLRIEDDDRMSQVTRLTPDVPFPEAEGPIRSSIVYGTPWPLGEDDYLCAYDPAGRNHGIYWIDRFGNHELIYRDESIPSLSPIPLCPRPVPPVITGAAVPVATNRPVSQGKPTATVAVMNVYDSDFQWPTEAKITQLRVIQILPKSTPSRNKPRVGVAEQTNARAVLGTVPVEGDGSACFEVPAGKLLYFQALDARGMALQSMRSGTYFHAGQRMACQGCHEPKRRAAKVTAPVRLALRRPPSKILPDCQGSNPFNYVRLVQPVLDRNCVGCHREKNALDLTGAVESWIDRDKNDCRYTRSYVHLAADYGFWFHALNHCLNTSGVHGGSRTIPGKFGARASRLLDYLDERHHGVKLSDEDFHRMALWLDCNSEFLGAYEEAEAQAHGKLVSSRLD